MSLRLLYLVFIRLCGRAGVTVRALRYYEDLGLVVPSRLPDGYRDYDSVAVRQVDEIRALTGLGLSVEATRPFVECLVSGHETGDECPASLAAYRRAIDQLSLRITELTKRRDALAAHLEDAANRAIPAASAVTAARIAEVTVSDGSAAGHLIGMRMPPRMLAATDGVAVRLDALGSGRTVLYVYPLTGRPGVDLPEGWDAIPARGVAPPRLAGSVIITPSWLRPGPAGSMAYRRRAVITSGN